MVVELTQDSSGFLEEGLTGEGEEAGTTGLELAGYSGTLEVGG
jgi:hypothetical protein